MMFYIQIAIEALVVTSEILSEILSAYVGSLRCESPIQSRERSEKYKKEISKPRRLELENICFSSSMLNNKVYKIRWKTSW
jgi:hypothetical protein